jgi:hypothetical protein
MSYIDDEYIDDDIWSNKEYPPMYLPCGGVAHFDESSGISYRCECGAVVGSIGQPQSCKDEDQKYKNWETLGGKGWDYNKGCPK